MKPKALCFYMCTAVFCIPFFAQTVFDLTVQPFSETEFFADGIQIQPRVLETDKSIAQVRFSFDTPPAKLDIKHKGFRPVIYRRKYAFAKKRLCVFIARKFAVRCCGGFSNRKEAQKPALYKRKTDCRRPFGRKRCRYNRHTNGNRYAYKAAR